MHTNYTAITIHSYTSSKVTIKKCFRGNQPSKAINELKRTR
jgi:hypothetical protein